MNLKSLLVFVLLLFATSMSAQFVDLGQDPVNIQWRQIKTDDFQLIYPDFFEENAQKMANIYALLYNASNSLAQKPKRISMIIHAKSGISNGSAGWAPKKSDLYGIPPQESGEPWLEHLCVHEFRHIVQYDKVNRGFTKLLYYIFGEQITMAVVGLYIPMWFLEGDAVAFETAVGHVGRGRSPEFLNEMKAQVLEQGVYSYDKAVLGSYKDNVPNRYTLGYFMTANTRKNYGSEIWQEALKRTGRRSYSITPFRTSLKISLNAKRDSLWNSNRFLSSFINKDSIKQANKYKDAKKTLYYDNFTELQAEWRSELSESMSHFDTLFTDNKYYTDYLYPMVLHDGSLIAYKKGFREHGAFVSIREGKEEIITRTGILYDHKYALNDSLIVWSEYLPHLRWEHGGKRVIASYNMKSKKYSYHHSTHHRYAPFKWGENWGVVETDEHNKASIVLLDRQFKEELLRIPALPDELFVHPSYNGKEIVTIAVSPQGNRILSINPQTRERTPLTEYVWCELDNPLSIDSSLYFRASWEGNNTLYRQDRTSDKTHAVLNAPFGVRFPAVNPQQDILYFSFYTSEGYKPGKIEMQLLQEGIFQPKSYALADSLVKYEEAKIDNMGDSIYESRRYRKLPHLLNVHSWGPMYVNQFDEEIDFGLIVYSQNKLSTLSLSAGFVRTGRYEDGAWVLNATYKGLWPKFSLDMKTSRPDDKRFYGITTEYIPSGESDSLLLRAKHRYSEAELTVSFPFNLSGRNYYRSVLPYIRYKMEAIHDYSIKNAYRYYFIGDTIKAWEVDKADYTLSIPSNFYQALEYGIRIANYTYTTEQEINPKWGQIIQAGYRHTPWKKLKLGEQWWVSGLFYLPGFYTNHSLSLYGGFQKAPDNNAYSNNVMSARGIGAYRSDMFTIRTTYQFPLVYPDWNFAGLVYIKALKGGLFFDYMQQQPKNKKIHNHSYGVELTADCHFLRLPFPINIGLRAGYESRTESLFADFLFNVGFYF